jgi:hypothetical protein
MNKMKDDGLIEMNKSITNKTSMSKLNNNNNNQANELNGVISSSLVSSIVNSFNNAAASSSRSSSPSFCSSSFTTNSSFTNKKHNHSRNSSMSGGLMNDDSGVVASEDVRVVKQANHKRTNSNSNVDNSTIITNNSVRAMANLLNRTSSTRASVIKHLPPSIIPSHKHHQLLNFIDNDTSSVFDDNITTSSSVSSTSNQNDQLTHSSTNSNSNNNQLNKSNRSSISNATTNNLDDYLDGNGDDLCNLTKLKIQQEEIKFNSLLTECQLWIEVKRFYLKKLFNTIRNGQN